MDWFRDSLWQFVGVITSIFAIVVSYAIFRKQERQKGITYNVISNTDLLTVKEEVKSKLQIFFDQKRVENLRLVILKIYNAGDEPISVRDYEEPITVEFGENAEILESDVVEVFPSDIKATLVYSPSKVTINPLLLNSGDSIKLKILLTKFDGKPHVSGRVVGVKQICGLDYYPVRLQDIRVWLTELPFFFIISVPLLITSISRLVNEPSNFINLLMGIIGLFLGLISIGIGISLAMTIYNKVKPLLK